MLLMAPLRLPVLQTQELVGKRSILAVAPPSTPVLALEQEPSSPGISIPPLARERSCSTSLAQGIRPMERSRLNRISPAMITLPLVPAPCSIMTSPETALQSATRQLALRRWRVTLMALQTPPLVLLRSYTVT